MEEIVFDCYSRLVEQYEEDKMLIPAGNLVELEYEELESVPLATLRKIYSVLDIPGFEMAEPDLNRQLQKETQYKKFEHKYDEETFKKIDRKWRKYIHRWNDKRNKAAQYARLNW